MSISRATSEIGKCRMIRHNRDKMNDPNPQRWRPKSSSHNSACYTRHTHTTHTVVYSAWWQGVTLEYTHSPELFSLHIKLVTWDLISLISFPMLFLTVAYFGNITLTFTAMPMTRCSVFLPNPVSPFHPSLFDCFKKINHSSLIFSNSVVIKLKLHLSAQIPL